MLSSFAGRRGRHLIRRNHRDQPPAPSAQRAFRSIINVSRHISSTQTFLHRYRSQTLLYFAFPLPSNFVFRTNSSSVLDDGSAKLLLIYTTGIPQTSYTIATPFPPPSHRNAILASYRPVNYFLWFNNYDTPRTQILGLDFLLHFSLVNSMCFVWYTSHLTLIAFFPRPHYTF